MPLGRTTSKTTAEGPPSSKWWDVPPWYKVLKESHSEAFSQETSLVREARKEYYKKHSPNFTTNGMHDLAEVFRHIATRLGHLQNPGSMEGDRWAATSQLCLEVFTKRPQVPPSGAPIRVPKGYGIGGHTWPRDPPPLQWLDPLPLVWQGGPEWGNSC